MNILGLEMTTLFDCFDIAFGPTNGMSRKILLYTHVQRQKKTTTESYSIKSFTKPELILSAMADFDVATPGFGGAPRT